MSQMIDFTLPSCQPGRTLHAFRCVPEGEVRAVLQLSHGMVEFRTWPPGASLSPATTTWATAGPSAPKRITATSANPTATAPCWRICTL